MLVQESESRMHLQMQMHIHNTRLLWRTKDIRAEYDIYRMSDCCIVIRRCKYRTNKSLSFNFLWYLDFFVPDLMILLFRLTIVKEEES